MSNYELDPPLNPGRLDLDTIALFMGAVAEGLGKRMGEGEEMPFFTLSVEDKSGHTVRLAIVLLEGAESEQDTHA